MRVKTQSGKVVSSHSSACGASSLVTNARIDSRSCSCSSLKMKCLRREPKSGLRTASAVAMRAKLAAGLRESKQWHFLLSAPPLARVFAVASESSTWWWWAPGPPGRCARDASATSGSSVALVEQQLVGGECSFYACMPSKALLRPGELLAEVRRIPGVSEAVTRGLDVPAVLARRDEIIHDLDDSGMLPWLEAHNITLVRGRARFEGERRLRVGDDVLVARTAVVVAAGSGAAVPPIDGLREARPWTNREATTTKEVPARLGVLGGGVVGVEMAQAWSTLGSQVTVMGG